MHSQSLALRCARARRGELHLSALLHAPSPVGGGRSPSRRLARGRRRHTVCCCDLLASPLVVVAPHDLRRGQHEARQDARMQGRARARSGGGVWRARSRVCAQRAGAYIGGVVCKQACLRACMRVCGGAAKAEGSGHRLSDLYELAQRRARVSCVHNTVQGPKEKKGKRGFGSGGQQAWQYGHDRYYHDSTNAAANAKAACPAASAPGLGSPQPFTSAPGR